MWSRTKHVYAAEGLTGFVRRCCRKVVHRFAETNSAYWFYRTCDSDEGPMVMGADVQAVFDGPDVTLRWLQEQGECWMRLDPEISVARAENHVLAHVKVSGEIIGYIKIALRRVYIHDYRACFPVPDKAAFIYDTYIIPRYRGRNIAPWLIVQAIRHVRGLGVRVIGCHIPPWNKASISAYEKCGFRVVDYIRFIRLFGLKLYIVRSAGRIQAHLTALEKYYGNSPASKNA
jgi:ribosomal protein S18 acetylase RimI-like enzyme